MQTRNILDIVEDKTARGERLTPEDGVALFECNDLIRLGQIANRVREKKNANNAFYILNHHIDYSNICVLSCKFCAFAKRPGEPGGFFHPVEYYLEKLSGDLQDGVTEVHIVGGLHPTLPFSYYTDLLSEIKKLSSSIHIKAFTAVEIDFFARLYRMGIEETLERLREAGLDSLPGGGAEILGKRVRDKICKEKIGGERWLEIHRIAHSQGFKTNATMLYGHLEGAEDRIEHLEMLRQLQDGTGGFLSFIPLAFNPENSELGEMGCGWTSGFDDLRTLAISRLYLDNFDHIKTYWITSGIGIAQLGLSFGADDVHGTVREENITHMAGAKVPEALTTADLRNLITAAGREPHQRDSLYNIMN